jgi:MinD-like ATPase involved in chromosome partitioning or flagellar assembly
MLLLSYPFPRNVSDVLYSVKRMVLVRVADKTDVPECQVSLQQAQMRLQQLQHQVINCF